MRFYCHFLTINAIIAHLSDAMTLYFLRILSVCPIYSVIYARAKGNNLTVSVNSSHLNEYFKVVFYIFCVIRNKTLPFNYF